MGLFVLTNKEVRLAGKREERGVEGKKERTLPARCFLLSFTRSFSPSLFRLTQFLTLYRVDEIFATRRSNKWRRAGRNAGNGARWPAQTHGAKGAGGVEGREGRSEALIEIRC